MSPQDEQEFRREYDRQTQRGETWLQKLVGLVYVPINLLLVLVIGAGLYQLGALLVKERLAFKHALAVRAYAELPPTVILSLFLIIQMYLRPPEEVVGHKGLLLGNLGFLVEDKDAHVILASIPIWINIGVTAVRLRAGGQFISVVKNAVLWLAEHSEEGAIGQCEDSGDDQHGFPSPF